MRLLSRLLALEAVMDFLAAVRQRNLAFMGQIHVVRTVLVARTDDGDFVSGLQSFLGPAVGPVQGIGAAQFGMPTLHGAALVLGFENNCGMRIDELEFQDGSLNSEGVLLVVTSRKAVMRQHRGGNREKPSCQDKGGQQSTFHLAMSP